MSDNIIEINNSSNYTLSIETSLLSNDNIILEINNSGSVSNNIDVINNTTVLVGDLPQGYPLNWTSGNLPIARVSGLDILGGSGISVLNNSGIFTVAVTGQFGLTGEQVDDRVSNLLVAGSYAQLNYNDNNNQLTISVTGLQPSGNYSVVGHSHVIADVSGLQNILDNKQPSGIYASGIHYHNSSDITNFDSAVDSRISLANLQPSGNYSLIGHNHSSSDITDFVSSVSGLLPVKNVSAGNGIQITNNSGDFNVAVTGQFGLTSEQVDDRVNDLLVGSNYITINYDDNLDKLTIGTSGLQPAGDYSVVGHSHIISDVSGLQNALDNKQPSGSYSPLVHTHSSSNITDFSGSVNSLVSGIYAPLNSPSFSGVPTVPTASSGTNNSQIANTQFVRTEISNLVNSAPNTLDTLNELAAALGNDPNFATTVASGLGTKAPLVHSHVSSDITNFNSSVSGLLPVTNIIGSSGIVISNSGSMYNVSSSGLAFTSGANFDSLSVTGVPVSVSGHKHSYTDITNFASGIDQSVSTLLIGGSYINLNYDNIGDTLTISATGLQPSGNYSLAGHSHSSSDITNFNSSVSGLLPPNIVTGIGSSGYLSKWTGSNSISSGIIFDNGTNIGIGTISPSVLLDVSGTILANRFTTTSANNINIGSGQIYLNGDTGNRIDFNGSGIGAPAFTTNRSPGTKIVLAPNTSSTQTEYALGIEAGAMWFSIPVAASRAFQWYAGTANIVTLLGNGTLDIKGSTSRINVDSLRLDDNMLSTTTANSDLILYPNGNGSLIADPSGNLRGIYSNDFQRERTSVSGVAAGGYSVICGGSDNRTANSYSIVCGGQTNTASNSWSTVCGGDLNTASGNRSVVVGGGSNTSSSQSSSVGGGSNNQSTGTYSTVPGGFRGKATRHGELSHSAGMFNNTGDAQHTILIARRLTTDATANVVLTLNGLAPTSTNIFNIPAQTMWTFSIKLSAYNLTNNEGAWWIFRGGIKRNNANSTVLVGSLITESGAETSLSTATATVVADDTNEALEIRVTGVSGKSIRWVAVADISQVSYGTP